MQRARPMESDRKQLLVHAAKTHLANERTYLAWVRTALILLGLALEGAVATDGAHKWEDIILGVAFYCVSLSSFAIGAQRYKVVREAIRASEAQSKDVFDAMPVGAVTALLALVSALFVGALARVIDSLASK